MTTVTAGHTTGATLRVEAIRLSDGKRYDWSDNTFKSSGWVTRKTPMTEDATTPGYYTLDFDTSNESQWPRSSQYRFILTDDATPNAVLSVQDQSLVGQDLVAPEVPASGLCTLAQIKLRLRMDPLVEDPQDDILDVWRLAAEETILRLTGYTVGTGTESRQEIYTDVQYGRPFSLERRPVLSVTSIKARDAGGSFTTIGPAEIKDAQRGRIYIPATSATDWPPVGMPSEYFAWRQPKWPFVQVTYVVDQLGSTTNPLVRALTAACVELAVSMYARAGGGALKSLSIERVTETYIEEDMPTVVRSLLARHIRDRVVVI